MTYYDILGISEQATSREITIAFENMVKVFDLDNYVGNKEFAKAKTIVLNKAYNILINPESRKKYDNSIKHKENTNMPQLNNLTNQSDTKIPESAKPIDDLPLNWFNFYTFIRLPLSLILMLFNLPLILKEFSLLFSSFNTYILTFQFYIILSLILNLIYTSITVYTTFTLRKFTKKSYYANLCLLIVSPVMYALKDILNPFYGLSSLAGAGIVSIANIIYFYKRKYMFMETENPKTLDKNGRVTIYKSLACTALIYFCFLFLSQSITVYNSKNQSNAVNNNSKPLFSYENYYWVTENGNKFHKYSCQYIQYATDEIYYTETKSEMYNNSYHPCQTCKP